VPPISLFAGALSHEAIVTGPYESAMNPDQSYSSNGVVWGFSEIQMPLLRVFVELPRRSPAV
jgi:hypothetical protein